MTGPLARKTPTPFADFVANHTHTFRNIEQLSDHLFIAEICEAKKITAKSVWRLHLFGWTQARPQWAHSKTIVDERWTTMGHVRKTTTWRGETFSVKAYSFGADVQFSTWLEAFVQTEKEANALLIGIAHAISF